MTDQPSWGNQVKHLRYKRARLSGVIVRRKSRAISQPMTKKERAKIHHQIVVKEQELAAIDQEIAKVVGQKTK